MIKKALIIFLFAFLGMAAGIAAPSLSQAPCPTCARRYVNTSLIEVLVAKHKDKGQDSHNLLPQGKPEKLAPATPVEKVASRTQQIFKSKHSQAQNSPTSPVFPFEAHPYLSQVQNRLSSSYFSSSQNSRQAWVSQQFRRKKR